MIRYPIIYQTVQYTISLEPNYIYKAHIIKK